MNLATVEPKMSLNDSPFPREKGKWLVFPAVSEVAENDFEWGTKRLRCCCSQIYRGVNWNLWLYFIIECK